MVKNSLNIISESLPKTAREIAFLKYDKMWQENPEQFNPLANVKEKVRIKRTEDLIDFYLHVEKENVVDLGCGMGILTQFFLKKGAKVHAVDASEYALKHLERNASLTLSQDYVPNTILKDQAYNVVLATEIIAYLNKDQYRLFFSECARVMKHDGQVVISTPLDIHSEDALERFVNLAETEFKILYHTFSYHRYYIQLLNFLNYKYLAPLMRPLIKFIEKNQTVLFALEKICKFIKDEAGITHIIFIGIKRPLFEETKESDRPVERKQKRQVWE